MQRNSKIPIKAIRITSTDQLICFLPPPPCKFHLDMYEKSPTPSLAVPPSSLRLQFQGLRAFVGHHRCHARQLLELRNDGARGADDGLLHILDFRGRALAKRDMQRQLRIREPIIDI